MSSQNLSITQAGAVARITLTQPEIRNAFSDEVIAEITAAFVDVGSRADVRAVVLAAEGPAFCAGANLNWMRRMADYTRAENLADAGALAEMLRTIHSCLKPTIARVQGDVFVSAWLGVKQFNIGLHRCEERKALSLGPAFVLQGLGGEAL